MFSILDQRSQPNEGQHLSRTEHFVRALSVLGIAALLFGSLYLTVLFME